MTKRLIIATLASAVVLTSCNKGTISSKRLDGTWNLTSGETKTIEDYGNGSIVQYTNTTTATLDGKTSVEAFSSTSSNYPSKNTTKTYTSKFTFDRGSDSYTLIEVSESSNTYNNQYFYSDPTCNTVVIGGSTIRTSTSTYTEKGGYQILGSTGDVEKNTRILLEGTSGVGVTNNVYKYMSGSTVLSAAYEINSGCVLLPSTDSETETNTLVPAPEGQIVTVKESSSSTMTIDVANKYSTVYPNYSHNTTTTGTKTYTKE